MGKRCLGFRHQFFQGRCSSKIYSERVRKTRPHQVGNYLEMEPIGDFENPHIKRDVISKLPVFDVHSEKDNNHLTITRGRALLAQMIKFCLDEGVFRFFIIHGTNSRRGGKKTWLQFLKKFFKDAIQVAWKKNKGVSVVYLSKLDKSRISELVQGAYS